MYTFPYSAQWTGVLDRLSSPADGDIVSKPYAVLWVTEPKKLALMASRDEQDEYGLWEE